MADMETLLRKENKQETEEIAALLDEMTPAERKDFLIFTRGVRFARRMTGANGREAGATAQQPM